MFPLHVVRKKVRSCVFLTREFRISGGTHNFPTSSIKPMESKGQCCSFVKTNQSLKGSVGVLTYELHAMRNLIYKETLAIMFSVPYDYNLFSNWCAVGIFESGRACDNSLFNEMYYNKEVSFARGKAGSQIKYEGKFHSVKASMSDYASSILTVELWNEVV